MRRNSTLKNADGAREPSLLMVCIGGGLKLVASFIFDQSSAPQSVTKLDYLRRNADCQWFSAGL